MIARDIERTANLSLGLELTQEFKREKNQTRRETIRLARALVRPVDETFNPA